MKKISFRKHGMNGTRRSLRAIKELFAANGTRGRRSKDPRDTVKKRFVSLSGKGIKPTRVCGGRRRPCTAEPQPVRGKTMQKKSLDDLAKK